MNFPHIEPLEARIAPATISITGATVNEGNSGQTPLNFTVTLDAAAATPTTVHLSTSDGTALATGPFPDYVTQKDTIVTFAAGQTTQQVPVQLIGDLFKEADETFTATLSQPSGSNAIGVATATGTITNDDADPAITIANAADVTEGAGVMSKFTVTLSHAVQSDVTVKFATGDSADTAKPAPGAFTDYKVATGTLTFTAGGALTQDISVAITNDIFKEDTEKFTVKLSAASGATLGTPSAVGQILNDADTIVGITLPDAKVVEGDIDHAITVSPTLSAKLATDVSVTLTTQSGTATDGSDFTGVSLVPVTITAGNISANSPAITIKGDAKFEATESFFVNLMGAPAGVTLANDHPIGSGAQVTGRVYIYNDDTQLLGPTKAQWIDVDGDLVTMKLTKGSLGLANLLTFDATTSAVGGRVLQKIDLSRFGNFFAGVGITITATKQAGFPDPSDGRVDVGFIQAAIFDPDELRTTGIDLGAVTIDGDLAKITAGDQFSTPAIPKLDVYSLGAHGDATLPSGETFESKILGPIGSVLVKQNIEGFLHVVGSEFGTIGTLKVGGALKGNKNPNSGRVAMSGRLGTATIGGITGGSGDSSGLLDSLLGANSSIGNITVTGDIIGGTGSFSGAIVAPRIGNVSAHNIKGAPSGSGAQSGSILSQSTLGTVTLHGDLVGGSAADSGKISAGTTIGAVKVEGKILGEGGDNSGSIQSGGNVTSLQAGIITGGDGKGSGSVRVGVDSASTVTNAAASIGAVTIAAPHATDDALIGGTGVNSGRLDVAGSIASITVTGNLRGGAATGSGEIFNRSAIGAIKINGALTGGSGDDSGSIQSGGNIKSLDAGVITGGGGKGSGSVRVGVDNSGTPKAAGASIGAVTITAPHATDDALIGGGGVNSGRIDVAAAIAGFTASGNIRGGTANGTGVIVAGGSINSLVIKGSLIGHDSAATALTQSGAILAGILKTVAITGDITSGGKAGAGAIASSGAIRADRIDLLTIGGKLIGNGTNPVFITASGRLGDLAIKSLTITGSVNFGEIRAGYNEAGATSADAGIGTVTFLDTVRGLDIVAGALADSVGHFGTLENVVASGNGVKDDPTLLSKIASVIFKKPQAVIAGSANFGIVAQAIDAITLGPAKIALKAGPENDRPPIEIGGATNFRAVELAPP